MISVTFEQQFLPTDTLVEIPEVLDKHPSAGILIGVGMLVVIFGLFVLLGCFSETLRKSSLSKMLLASWIAGVATVAAGVLMFVTTNNDYESKREAFSSEKEAYTQLAGAQAEKNRENLYANIESVYDIQKIEFEPDVLESITKAQEGNIGSETETRHPLESSVEAVVIQDGLAYEVLLSQNPDTYEPMLSIRTTSHSDAQPIRKK